MKPEYDLLSFHIIEKFHKNALITWTYPSISEPHKASLLTHCFKRSPENAFSYIRIDKHWLYFWEQYKEQKSYALVLITKCYHPEKYRHFGQHLCSIYESSYKAIDLVKIFLGAFTNGSYNVQQNGTSMNVYLNDLDFKHHIQHDYFQELVEMFDVEIILIFNAILLKKRIVVYHSLLHDLLKFIDMMTHLIDWKLRDPNEYLFPYVRNIAGELKGRVFFLAGVTDRNINIKPDGYDLFVNAQTANIKISPNSNEIFQMTKWHKEIATLLTQDGVLGELYKRTDGFLANLKTFASTRSGEGVMMITLEELRSKKLAPAMENFLFNLAVAENIMML